MRSYVCTSDIHKRVMFANYIFANITSFAKFAKISSRENFQVHGKSSPGSYTPTKWPDPWPYVELGYAYTPPNVPRLTPNTSDRHAKLPDMEVCDQRGQPSVSVPHNGQEED